MRTHTLALSDHYHQKMPLLRPMIIEALRQATSPADRPSGREKSAVGMRPVDCASGRPIVVAGIK
jgi:hypothetical protein